MIHHANEAGRGFRRADVFLSVVTTPTLCPKQERRDQYHLLSGWPVPTIFPVSYSGGINAERRGELLLGHTLSPAGSGEPFGKRICRREGVVPQESDNRRDVLDRRLGCVALPVGDGQWTDPDEVGNLRLEETEVDPAGSDMVA